MSENNEKVINKSVINWLITINLRTSTNPYFIRDYYKIDNTYFI